MGWGGWETLSGTPSLQCFGTVLPFWGLLGVLDSCSKRNGGAVLGISGGAGASLGPAAGGLSVQKDSSAPNFVPLAWRRLCPPLIKPAHFFISLLWYASSALIMGEGAKEQTDRQRDSHLQPLRGSGLP